MTKGNEVSHEDAFMRGVYTGGNGISRQGLQICGSHSSQRRMRSMAGREKSRSDGDNVGGLKQNYKDVKREAKAEYRNVKDHATRIYRKNVEKAREAMDREAARRDEEFRIAQQEARKEYERALETAKDQYEFTVEIAKDQYKTEKKETRHVVKEGKNVGK